MACILLRLLVMITPGGPCHSAQPELQRAVCAKWPDCQEKLAIFLHS